MGTSEKKSKGFPSICPPGSLTMYEDQILLTMTATEISRTKFHRFLTNSRKTSQQQLMQSPLNLYGWFIYRDQTAHGVCRVKAKPL